LRLIDWVEIRGGWGRFCAWRPGRASNWRRSTEHTHKHALVGGTRLFTGQRLDQSGLYFYNARYYDPQIGRFISADTVVPDPSDPQNLNRYSYVLNNPLKYTDPSGHFFDILWDIVGVVWDVVEFVRDPSAANAGFLAADVGCMLVPFVPAVAGITTRGAKVGKAAVSHGDDLVRLGNKADDAASLAARAQDVATHGDDLARLRAERMLHPGPASGRIPRTTSGRT
jgi:RHS repeat-associated protein